MDTSDEKQTQFMSVTGADAETAKQLLKVAGDDVEFAVQLFLEDDSHRPSETSPLAEPSKKRTIAPDDSESGDGDRDKNRASGASFSLKSKPRSPPQVDLTKDSDEPGLAAWLSAAGASSRRTNVLAGPVSPASASMAHASRAPRPSTLAKGTDTSMSTSTDARSGEGGPAGAWQIGSSTTAARPSVTVEAFRDFASDSEFLESLNRADGSSLTRPERLSDLFRPPLDVIYRGSFDEARNIARIQRRWLLVNLQDIAEFSCQMLNRDLWREAEVKAFIKEHFIFCQLAAESSQGARYKSYYPVQSYPHYALLDPRTGERVKVWHTILKPLIFLQEAIEFIESHPLEDIGPAEAPSQPAEMVARRTEKCMSPISRLSPMALREPHTPRQSSYPKLEGKENPEPADDSADLTRIQFRLTDGSRAVRKFSKHDPVRCLFQYVLFLVPESRSTPFDLLFLNNALSSKMDSSILEAGVDNSVITLKYLL